MEKLNESAVNSAEVYADAAAYEAISAPEATVPAAASAKEELRALEKTQKKAEAAQEKARRAEKKQERELIKREKKIAREEAKQLRIEEERQAEMARIAAREEEERHRLEELQKKEAKRLAALEEREKNEAARNVREAALRTVKLQMELEKEEEKQKKREEKEQRRLEKAERRDMFRSYRGYAEDFVSREMENYDRKVNGMAPMAPRVIDEEDTLSPERKAELARIQRMEEEARDAFAAQHKKEFNYKESVFAEKSMNKKLDFSWGGSSKVIKKKSWLAVPIALIMTGLFLFLSFTQKDLFSHNKILGFLESLREPAAVNSGVCGDGVTWSLSESGVLTISGEGDMYPYSSAEETPWAKAVLSSSLSVGAQTEYSTTLKMIQKVTVDEGVSSIAVNAFAGLPNLSRFTVHPDNADYTTQDGVLYTRDMKILMLYPAGMTAESFVVPEGVVAITANAFNGASFHKVSFPATLTKVPSGLLAGCTSLREYDYAGTESEWEAIGGGQSGAGSGAVMTAKPDAGSSGSDLDGKLVYEFYAYDYINPETKATGLSDMRTVHIAQGGHIEFTVNAEKDGIYALKIKGNHLGGRLDYATLRNLSVPGWNYFITGTRIEGVEDPDVNNRAVPEAYSVSAETIAAPYGLDYAYTYLRKGENRIRLGVAGNANSASNYALGLYSFCLYLTQEDTENTVWVYTTPNNAAALPSYKEAISSSTGEPQTQGYVQQGLFIRKEGDLTVTVNIPKTGTYRFGMMGGASGIFSLTETVGKDTVRHVNELLNITTTGSLSIAPVFSKATFTLTEGVHTFNLKGKSWVNYAAVLFVPVEDTAAAASAEAMPASLTVKPGEIDLFDSIVPDSSKTVLENGVLSVTRGEENGFKATVTVDKAGVYAIRFAGKSDNTTFFLNNISVIEDRTLTKQFNDYSDGWAYGSDGYSVYAFYQYLQKGENILSVYCDHEAELTGMKATLLSDTPTAILLSKNAVFNSGVVDNPNPKGEVNRSYNYVKIAADDTLYYSFSINEGGKYALSLIGAGSLTEFSIYKKNSTDKIATIKMSPTAASGAVISGDGATAYAVVGTGISLEKGDYELHVTPCDKSGYAILQELFLTKTDSPAEASGIFYPSLDMPVSKPNLDSLIGESIDFASDLKIPETSTSGLMVNGVVYVQQKEANAVYFRVNAPAAGFYYLRLYAKFEGKTYAGLSNPAVTGAFTSSNRDAKLGAAVNEDGYSPYVYYAFMQKGENYLKFYTESANAEIYAAKVEEISGITPTILAGIESAGAEIKSDGTVQLKSVTANNNYVRYVFKTGNKGGTYQFGAFLSASTNVTADFTMKKNGNIVRFYDKDAKQYQNSVSFGMPTYEEDEVITELFDGSTPTTRYVFGQGAGYTVTLEPNTEYVVEAKNSDGQNGYVTLNAILLSNVSETFTYQNISGESLPIFGNSNAVQSGGAAVPPTLSDNAVFDTKQEENKLGVESIPALPESVTANWTLDGASRNEHVFTVKVKDGGYYAFRFLVTGNAGNARLLSSATGNASVGTAVSIAARNAGGIYTVTQYLSAGENTLTFKTENAIVLENKDAITVTPLKKTDHNRDFKNFIGGDLLYSDRGYQEEGYFLLRLGDRVLLNQSLTVGVESDLQTGNFIYALSALAGGDGYLTFSFKDIVTNAVYTYTFALAGGSGLEMQLQNLGYVALPVGTYSVSVEQTGGNMSTLASMSFNYLRHTCEAHSVNVVQPTCTENGVTEQICFCGNVISSTPIAATGRHTWSDWTVTKPAACGVKGEEIIYCILCDAIQATNEIAALQHDFSGKPVIDIPATCKEPGKQSLHCAYCDIVKEGSVTEIPKTTTHSYQYTVVLEPTETMEGYADSICTVCREADPASKRVSLQKKLPVVEGTINGVINHDKTITVSDVPAAGFYKVVLEGSYVDSAYVSIYNSRDIAATASMNSPREGNPLSDYAFYVYLYVGENTLIVSANVNLTAVTLTQATGAVPHVTALVGSNTGSFKRLNYGESYTYTLEDVKAGGYMINAFLQMQGSALLDITVRYGDTVIASYDEMSLAKLYMDPTALVVGSSGSRTLAKIGYLYFPMDGDYTVTVTQTVEKKSAYIGAVILSGEHEHAYTEPMIVAPNCLRVGYTADRCSCGEIANIRDEMPVSAHTYLWSVTAPTTDTVGKAEYRCSLCGTLDEAKTVELPTREPLSATDTYTGTIDAENKKIKITVPAAGFYRVLLEGTNLGVKEYIMLYNEALQTYNGTSAMNRVPLNGDSLNYGFHVFLYAGENTLAYEAKNFTPELTRATATQLLSEVWVDIGTVGSSATSYSNKATEYTFHDVKSGIYYLHHLMYCNNSTTLSVTVKKDGVVLYALYGITAANSFVDNTEIDGSSGSRLLAEYGCIYLPTDGDYTVTVTATSGSTMAFGALYLTETHQHSYVETPENRHEPTCGANAYVDTVCSCGYIGPVELTGEGNEATGQHTYQLNYKAPSCGESGYEMYICSLCGVEDEARYTELPALADAHNYKLVEKLPTCQEDGYRKYVCTICKTEKDTVVLPKNADLHNYRLEEKPATCQEDGYRKYVCSFCQDVKSEETLPVDENAHQYYTVTLVEATCQNEGKTQDICSLCGVRKDEVIVPVLPHASFSWTIREPNTLSKGLAIYACDACGERQDAIELAPRKGVAYDTLVGVIDNTAKKITVSDVKIAGLYRIVLRGDLAGKGTVTLYNEAYGEGHRSENSVPAGGVSDNCGFYAYLDRGDNTLCFTGDVTLTAAILTQEVADSIDVMQILEEFVKLEVDGEYTYTVNVSDKGFYFLNGMLQIVGNETVTVRVKKGSETLYVFDKLTMAHVAWNSLDAVSATAAMALVEYGAVYLPASGEYKISVSYNGEDDYAMLGNLYLLHSHIFTNPVYTAPTCVDNGYNTYTCACGETHKEVLTDTDNLPTGNHSYQPGGEEATCEKKGYSVDICTVCGDVDEDSYVTLPMGHLYKPQGEDPTCTESGYTENVCVACGDKEIGSYQELPPKHALIDVTVLPTCTEDGYTYKKCSVCGEEDMTTKVVEPNTALGGSHTYEWVLTEPDFENKGKAEEVCTRCDYVNAETTVVIPERVTSTGTLTGTVVNGELKLTASVGGFYRVVLSDALVGKGYVSIYNAANGFKPLTARNRIPEGAAPKDYPLYVYLNKGENTVIIETASAGAANGTLVTLTPAIGETIAYKDTSFSSYRTLEVGEGKTDSQIFTLTDMAAGVYYLQQMVNLNTGVKLTVTVRNAEGTIIAFFDALTAANTYLDENDAVNGSDLTRILGEYGMIYIPEKGNYTVEVKVVAGKTYISPLFLLSPHEHVYSTPVRVEPTCVANAYNKTVCDCGAEMIGEPLTGEGNEKDNAYHDYETVTVKQPTCVAEGYTDSVCTICGHVDTEKRTVLSKTEHDANSPWIVKKEPTYTEMGERWQNCSICGRLLEMKKIPTRVALMEDILHATVGAGNKIAVTAPVAGFYRVVLTNFTTRGTYITLYNEDSKWGSHTASVNRYPADGVLNPYDYPLYVYLVKGENTLSIQNAAELDMTGVTLTLTQVVAELPLVMDTTTSGSYTRLNSAAFRTFVLEGVTEGVYYLHHMMKMEPGAVITVTVKDKDGNIVAILEKLTMADIYLKANDATDGSSYSRILTEYGCVYLEDGDYTVEVLNVGDKYILVGSMFLTPSHEHAYGDAPTKEGEATCGNNAYKLYICDCGYEKKEILTGEGNEATGLHDYQPAAEGSEGYLAPTCTADGYVKHICTVCGAEDESLRETLDKLDHAWENDETEGTSKAPTCTEPGFRQEYCTRCGETRQTELPIDPEKHSFDEVTVKAATCTEDGVKQEVCAYCGTAKEESEGRIPAVGHSYTWVVKEPTETALGEAYEKCLICSEKGETTVPLAVRPALGAAMLFGEIGENNLVSVKNVEAPGFYRVVLRGDVAGKYITVYNVADGAEKAAVNRIPVSGNSGDYGFYVYLYEGDNTLSVSAGVTLSSVILTQATAELVANSATLAGAVKLDRNNTEYTYQLNGVTSGAYALSGMLNLTGKGSLTVTVKLGDRVVYRAVDLTRNELYLHSGDKTDGTSVGAGQGSRILGEYGYIYLPTDGDYTVTVTYVDAPSEEESKDFAILGNLYLLAKAD